MTTYSCENCGLVEDTDVREVTERLPVKGGEPIEVSAPARFCARCGERVPDEEFDDVALLKAYEIYRSRHNLITPEEIRGLRERYGLTQRGLSALMGWGEISAHRFESGSLPDAAHNQLLRFIDDPWNMRQMLESHGDRLNPAARRKLAARLQELLKERTPAKLLAVAAAAGARPPGPFTGFRAFDPEVLMEMMVYFAGGSGVYKTKLLKQLWYADFLHYRLNSVSISGATYCHLPLGPVPDQYQEYLTYLQAAGDLELEERYFENADVPGELLKAARSADEGMFTPSAWRVMAAVQRYFAAMGAREIMNLTHQEAGWLETKPQQAIAYSYADQLKVAEGVGKMMTGEQN